MLAGVISYALYYISQIKVVEYAIDGFKLAFNAMIYSWDYISNKFEEIRKKIDPTVFENKALYNDVSKHNNYMSVLLLSELEKASDYLKVSREYLSNNIGYIAFTKNPENLYFICDQVVDLVDDNLLKCKEELLLFYDYIHLVHPQAFDYFQEYKKYIGSIKLSKIDYSYLKDDMDNANQQFETIDDAYKKLLGVRFISPYNVEFNPANFAYPRTLMYDDNNSFGDYMENYRNLNNLMIGDMPSEIPLPESISGPVTDSSNGMSYMNVGLVMYLIISAIYFFRMLYGNSKNWVNKSVKNIRGFLNSSKLNNTKQPVRTTVRKKETQKQTENSSIPYQNITPYRQDYIEDRMLLDEPVVIDFSDDPDSSESGLRHRQVDPSSNTPEKQDSA